MAARRRSAWSERRKCSRSPLRLLSKLAATSAAVAAQNTRYEDLTPTQRENFVELTGKAGTVVIFTHDIIHTSWHETDTYRRVVHCTYQTGSEVAAPTNDDPEEWLE